MEEKGNIQLSFFGLVLIWFAAFGLFFIVYLKDTRGVASLVIDVIVTIVITFIASKQLKKCGDSFIKARESNACLCIVVGMATFPLL